MAVEIGPNDPYPQSTKTPAAAAAAEVMKKPPRRPKSNARRKVYLALLEPIMGEPSPLKVEA
jgi:hypothetical protein